MAVTVQLSRLWAPVTVLGPGRRLGVWVQGCGLACPGCSARDTWDPDGGSGVDADELAAMIVARLADDDLDGITLTGGEPTDQPDALADTIAAVRGDVPEVDVLMFTGRTLSAARAVAPELCGLSSCIVAGPYRQELPQTSRLVASSNQQVWWSDPAARERYERWLADDGPAVQVAATDNGLWLIGLTAPGDLTVMETQLKERGVVLGDVSWRE